MMLFLLTSQKTRNTMLLHCIDERGGGRYD